MIKKLIVWGIAGLPLFLTEYMVPTHLIEQLWFNSLHHFGGGLWSAWFSWTMLGFVDFRRGWQLNLSGFMAMFSGIYSCFAVLEILNFFRVDEVFYPKMYPHLIDNLHLFLVLSFFVSLSFAQFGFSPTDRRFIYFLDIIGGALVSGALWELYEFYGQGTERLLAITHLTLYEDTLKDLFFDGFGGLVFWGTAFFRGRV